MNTLEMYLARREDFKARAQLAKADYDSAYAVCHAWNKAINCLDDDIAAMADEQSAGEQGSAGDTEAFALELLDRAKQADTEPDGMVLLTPHDARGLVAMLRKGA